MRILLDECVDRRLAAEITGHQVFTVPQMGWAGKRNGELLRLAADQFDVFITVDKNLPLQHDLTDYDLAVVVLVAISNRVEDLRRLIPELQLVLPTAVAGQFYEVSWPQASLQSHC